jgi:hypothetical protein
MEKLKSKLIILLIIVVCSSMLTSCLTTKTSVGSFKEIQGSEYTYSKGKQLWLFWGIFPLGRTNVNTPVDGNCEVITRFNFGDVLLSGLTFGIVTSYSIKVKAKKQQVENKSTTNYDFKNGEKVVFTKGKHENVEGEIIAIYPDRALIKFKRSPTMVEKAKGIKDDVEDQIEVPFVNIAKK